MNAFISWITSKYPQVTMLWKHHLLGFSIQFPVFFFAHQTVITHSSQEPPSLPNAASPVLWRWEGRVLGWGHRCLLFRPAKPNGIPGGHVDDWECHGCGRAPHVRRRGHAPSWWERLTGYLRATLTLHFCLISFTLCSKTRASKPSPPRFRGRPGRCCFYSLCSNLRALSSHRFIHK